MPSPFPGMNPYLERRSVWLSFHQNFITVCQFHLAGQLGPQYVVQTEHRLYIHEPTAEERFLGKADVWVARPPTGGTAAGGGAIAAPAVIEFPEALYTERVPYLVIRDADGNELITVIELLSPTNKLAGQDREQYLGKRRELLRSRTHFVELDLLRGGPRMPPDELPTCDYCALVSPVEDRPRVGVWPWRLRDPLPELPVPLRAPDPPVRLDLKAVIDQVYDAGRYANYAYRGPPEPRLAPDDFIWASQFLPPATPR